MGNGHSCGRCKCSLSGSNKEIAIELQQDDHQMGPWLTELANKTIKITQHNGGDYFRIKSCEASGVDFDFYCCTKCYHSDPKLEQ